MENNGLPEQPVSGMAAASDGSVYAAVYGAGVYKTTNQGATWVAVSSGLSNLRTTANGLAVAPGDPSALYLVTDSAQLFRTADGGANWALAGTLPISPAIVAVSAGHASELYAAGLDPAGAYRSADAGATWLPIGTGLETAAAAGIVPDPVSPSTAYVVAPVRTGGFVTELNPAGSGLVYSTFLTGGDGGYPSAVAIDGSGGAVVTGYAAGVFPFTGEALKGNPIADRAFVARIGPSIGGCTYSVTPVALEIDGRSRALSFGIAAPGGCAWTASSDSRWAFIANGGTGIGSGFVSVSVAENTTTSARTATLSIAGLSATLTQSAGYCSYSLSPSSVSLPVTGGTVTASLTTGATCPWTVVNNYPSAVSVKGPASGTGSGTVSISVAANRNPGPQPFIVPVGGATWEITQGGTCDLSLSRTGAPIAADGETVPAYLTNPLTRCGWTAAGNATPRVTVASAASGAPGGTADHSGSANAGAQHTGALAGAGLTFTPLQGVSPLLSTSYLLSTLAGGQGMPPTATAATSVWMQVERGIATDASGNVYLNAMNAVFKVDPSGTLTRFAGTGESGFAGDGGLAINAKLNQPMGLAVDALGNVYISDSYNSRIRKVNLSGVITTVAGSASNGYGGDGGPATMAKLLWPYGIALDAAGNLYIADWWNQRVRKVSTNGIITTIAGTGIAGYNGTYFPVATSAQLSYPPAVAVDSVGNVYIADNGWVRKVDPAGVFTTVAGIGPADQCGMCTSVGDGGLATESFVDPNGLAVDSSGDLIISDSASDSIRIVDASGIINTIPGGGAGGDDVAIDNTGSFYVPQYTTSRVVKISASGTVSTLAGGSIGDGGPGALAGLAGAYDVVKDSAGNIYIATVDDNRVRKIDRGGTITTLAGTGVAGYSGDAGPATAAQLNAPYGLALDKAGNLYIADSQNNRVRMVNPSGTITTFAGLGEWGWLGDGGPAVNAQFESPVAVAIDGSGNVFIADEWNDEIRVVTPDGIINTYASAGGESIAVDGAGNLYVADSFGDRILKVDTKGAITVVAGTGAAGFSGDGGPATSAQLNNPKGVAVDALGQIYICDANNGRVRKADISGTISSIANTGCEKLFVESSGDAYLAAGGSISLLTPVNQMPVLSVRSSHSGSFQQGQSGAVYTLTVTNEYLAGSASGAVTVKEMLPAGMTLASMSGSGWTCTSAAPAPACTRSDTLNGNYNYPSITATVDISATAPAQLTNVVTVEGGGAAMEVGEDFTLIAPASAPDAPVLSAPGNGITAASAAPTLTWNAAARASWYTVYFGPSPAAMSLVATTANTSYALGGLSPGAVYYWSVTAVNNLGPQSSNTWSFTPAVAALSVAKTHTGNFTPGQAGAAFTVTVSNAASVGPTSGTVTVTETLPVGLSLVSMRGNGWSCPSGGATCTRNDPLAPGASYPAISVTVSVDGGATSPQVNSVLASGGGSASANATDAATILAQPALSVAKTHLGNFAPGRVGPPYTVTVSNAAASLPTSGEVTVTETVPAGLTLVSMAGAGWTCASPSNTCSRSDALPGGASYPPITVTVNVASGAASPQVNSVSVSGGGSASVAASDIATIAAGYTVGDVYPIGRDDAPNFGNGVLDILDLIQELFAVNSIPGYRPAACSDRFDAMDPYPPDSASSRGGDGILDVRDLILELFRVNNLDPARPVRTSRGGVCASSGTAGTTELDAARRGGATPAIRTAAGAVGLGPLERQADGGERAPVYLSAAEELTRVAVTFGLGDRQSKLKFTAADGLAPSLVEDSRRGVVAAAWLEGVSVPAGGRLLLGYVSGPAGALAKVQFYGVSASGLDDNRQVPFNAPAGAGR